MRFIQLKDGLKEKAVFLLHGSTQRYYKDSHPLSLFLKEQNVNARVITVELPGHGASVFSRVMTPKEIIDSFSSEFIAFLNREGIRQACIIGYSLGGLLGIKLLERNDERVKCVIAIATGVFMDHSDQQRIQLFFTSQTYDALNYTRGMIQLHGEVGWRFLLESLHEMFFVGSPILLDKTKVIIDETFREPKRGLLILGSEDEAFPAEKTRAVIHEYPFLKLQVLPGIGHFEYFTRAFGDVCKAMKRFMEEHSFL